MRFTNVLLKARHWQLFLLLFGIPFGFQIYTIVSVFSSAPEPYQYTNPDSVAFAFSGAFVFFPIVMVAMLLVFFGWFWSMGIGLQPRLPATLKINTTFFKVSIFFPFIYTTAISIGVGMMMSDLFSSVQNGYQPGPLATIGGVLVFFQFFAVICIFYSMYFTAKTLKSAELQRPVTFSDFAGEFFLIWFFPIGIWIIQPRLNKLAQL